MYRNKSKLVILMMVLSLAAALLAGCGGGSSSGSSSGSNSASNSDTSSASSASSISSSSTSTDAEYVYYYFRNDKLLTQHYEKHGIDMGFASKEEYEKAASDVINNPDALHKIEEEDGDDVYYLEESNDFVVLSTDGYIRTYFWPDSGKKYYDKQ